MSIQLFIHRTILRAITFSSCLTQTGGVPRRASFDLMRSWQEYRSQYGWWDCLIITCDQAYPSPHSDRWSLFHAVFLPWYRYLACRVSGDQEYTRCRVLPLLERYVPHSGDLITHEWVHPLQLEQWTWYRDRHFHRFIYFPHCVSW